MLYKENGTELKRSNFCPTCKLKFLIANLLQLIQKHLGNPQRVTQFLNIIHSLLSCNQCCRSKVGNYFNDFYRLLLTFTDFFTLPTLLTSLYRLLLLLTFAVNLPVFESR